MATDFFIRWFQYGIFTPHFRPPALAADAEPWRLPAPTQPVLADYVRLRYRLEPYIRSVFPPHGDACFPRLDHRGLSSRHVPGPFHFGPSLFVRPHGAPPFDLSPVNLPADSAWIDFWTGATHAGGRVLRVSTVRAALPLFVRAGSILPLASAEPAPPDAPPVVELRVYPGADCSLSLPMPDAHPVLITWKNRERRLDFEPAGAAPDESRPTAVFRIVFVRAGHGVGIATCEFPDHVVRLPARAAYSLSVSRVAAPRVGLRSPFPSRRFASAKPAAPRKTSPAPLP